ncbi:MAG: beta-propeller domain-containing protein [Candidatus Lernaella stagnicola]|nr:beta-propeller domain-containing protein [Candidatus Lernaella stagnicola]
MKFGKWIMYGWLAFALVASFRLAACATGDGDSDIYTDKAGLYRCRDCGDVITWLQQNATMEMERAIDAIYSEDWYEVPEDDWSNEDDTAAPGGDDDDFAADDDQAGGEMGDDDGGTGDGDARGDDYTDTNVQEEGVDEADMVKTDGNYLYLVTGGYFILFDANPQVSTEEISRVDIEGYVSDMYLYGDKALVFSRVTRDQAPAELWPDVPEDERYWNVVKVSIVDHSDKTDPFVEREMYVEGELVSSRMIDAGVRIVTTVHKTLAGLEYYLDGYDYTPEELEVALEELKAQNRAIIEESTLEDWLPRYYNVIHTAGGMETETGLLSECPDHYRPEDPMGTAILSVLTVRMDDPTARQLDISIIADGYMVYASQENLYVSGTIDTAWGWVEPEQFDDLSPIHRFDIASNPEEAVYKGSAEVRGWMLNQFSMSEWQGHLRVATSYGGWRTGTPERNGVFCFSLDDQQGLVPAGSLENLALDEQIYAARMMGPRGYLVTFEQTDPLFTIDLSDPENPTLVGELEIPGFSTYLHPMGEDYLLAVGQGGDEWGSDGTLALSLFDVSDFANPQKLWGHNFGWVGSAAAYDHHAFLYDPSRDLLAIPIIDWGYGDDWGDEDETVPGDDPVADDDEPGADDDEPVTDDDDEPGSGDAFAGVVVMDVTVADGFAELARIDHSLIEPEAGSDDYWGLPEPRRSVRIGDYLFTISTFGLVVTEIGTWDNEQEISLPWEEEYYGWDDGWEDGGDVPPEGTDGEGSDSSGGDDI